MNELNPHTNDDLDDLKSLWKEQSVQKNYGKDEIFKMIHRKSINSVQWLFIITILELIFGLTISLWTVFSGNHFSSEETINIVGEDLFRRMENLSHLGLVGSLILFGIMFYFYRKISSSLSVQGLISTILRFRKVVMWFIIFWIVFTLVIFVPIIMEMGSNIYFNAATHENESVEQMNKSARQMGYIMAGINIALILVFFGLYYGIIYGIFLRRLGKNLKELKKIDE